MTASVAELEAVFERSTRLLRQSLELADDSQAAWDRGDLATAWQLFGASRSLHDAASDELDTGRRLSRGWERA